MSRVDHQTHHQNDVAAAAKRRLEATGNEVQIEPSDEVKRKVGYLSRLRTTTRRPPELRLSLHGTAKNDGLDEVLLPEVARIAETETTEFAFAVAELAWRLEGQIAATDDDGAKEGHAVLSQIARMYEHLFILQTGPEG
ncbi:MAG: hypothetical protein HC844_03855 [Tabrizicola sp.]|nr:hypothetical protein [Tabrizicola sp.]